MSISLGHEHFLGLVQIRSKLWKWTCHPSCSQGLGSQAEQGTASSHHPKFWASPWEQKQPRWSWRPWVNSHRNLSTAWWHATLLNVSLCHWGLSKNWRGPMWVEMAAEGPALGATCAVLPVTGPLGLARKEHWWGALPGMAFPKDKTSSLLQKLKFFVVIPGKGSSLKSSGHVYKGRKTIMVEVV